MHAVALLALGASVASAAGVTSIISPSGTAPASCATSYPGVFQATVVALSAGMKEKRQAMNATSASALNLTLANGILKDSPLGRFGYIASNYQLQFDANVPQAGALYTAGFSVCANGSLALGSSNVFYECLSGDFYNLYSQSIGGQCQPILINALSASGSSSASTTTTAVSQISDGQVQATTAATSAPKVSQITDGQIQATTPVTSAPKTTSSVPKITQITDGQIQATTPVTSVPKTTTSSSSSVARISQITDGQIQATTPATSAPALFTGAAVMPKVGGEFFAAAAGVAALALF